MDAMTMSFDVSEPKELEGVTPGMTVEFTLVLERPIGPRRTRSASGTTRAAEQDPLTARRLKLLQR